MLRAVVVGNVWATRRLAELPNGAFLEVEVEEGGARLVAFDVLGSGIGERVLVATGSVAAAWFPGKPPPLDALIIGSIDPDTGAETAAPGEASGADPDGGPRHAAGGAQPPAGPPAAPAPPERIVPEDPVTPVVPDPAPPSEPPAPPWSSGGTGGADQPT
jgi:ethanolamine utilization protein EutN